MAELFDKNIFDENIFDEGVLVEEIFDSAMFDSSIFDTGMVVDRICTLAASEAQDVVAMVVVVSAKVKKRGSARDLRKEMKLYKGPRRLGYSESLSTEDDEVMAVIIEFLLKEAA